MADNECIAMKKLICIVCKKFFFNKRERGTCSEVCRNIAFKTSMRALAIEKKGGENSLACIPKKYLTRGLE